MSKQMSTQTKQESCDMFLPSPESLGEAFRYLAKTLGHPPEVQQAFYDWHKEFAEEAYSINLWGIKEKE